jgi:serine protease AprX
MGSFLVTHSKVFTRLAVLWLVLLAAAAGFADNSKISPDLQPLLANSANSVNVIVQYNASQGCTIGGLVGDLLCPVVNLLGGVVNVVFTLINGVAGTMSAGDVVALSNQSNVSYISLDRPVNATLDYTGDAVNAPYAWNSGFTGAGIGIAVIDSGIYPHPDLNTASGQSRVVYRQSFISGGVQYDDYGHGTHVAGIAAGNGSSSSMPGTLHLLKGIAPNANLLDLRVLDLNGASTDSIVIAAIQQAVKLKNQYNVRVINLSVGRQIFESCAQDPLCQAVEAAWKNGIVVVTAAGNLGRNGYATITSPGNSPHAITVGCMKTLETYPRSDDQIASYSSKGPTYVDLTVKPDVVAPGNLVVSLLAPGSTLAAEFPANVVPPSYYTTSSIGPAEYFRLSGTSMATPVVSGAAALMLQENPNLSPDTVKARLMKTATKTFPPYSVATDPTTGQSYVDFYDIFTVGAGYIDIEAALNSADVANGSAQSPSVMYNFFTQQATLVTNNNEIWGQGAMRNVVWGSGNVWGTNVVWGSSDFIGATSALQRGNVVWGSSGDWGTSAVWGTNVVWGSTSGNGEN